MDDPEEFISAPVYSGAMITLSACMTLHFYRICFYLAVIARRLLSGETFKQAFRTIQTSIASSLDPADPSAVKESTQRSLPAHLTLSAKRTESFQVQAAHLFNYRLGYYDFDLGVGLLEAILHFGIVLSGLVGVISTIGVTLVFFIVLSAIMLSLGFLNIQLHLAKGRGRRRPWFRVFQGLLGITYALQCIAVILVVLFAVEFNDAHPGFIIDSIALINF